MKTIYLDNNATTQVDPAVFEAMRPYFTELYGNPSSIHRFGGQVGVKINEARASVAKLLGCRPDEIIFTSCGSESDNTAIRSALNAQPDKRHIITTAVEHPAVLSFCKFLAKTDGYEVTFLSTDERGRLDMDEYRAAFRPDTALVSVMWANNETGNIHPVEAMAEIARDHGAVFHTDAVQAVGKVPIDLGNSAVDMLSLSGHKLHAPKGVGALFVRKGLRFRPLLVGGHQEHNRRAGTENTTGIIALGKACELAAESMQTEVTDVSRLRDKLESGLLAAVPDALVNGDPDSRLPNTTNISFGYVEGEAILLMMDQLGIAASSGSACTSGSLEPSHVLKAMGVPFTFAHGSIRFSLSRFNTEKEIDFVIENLPPIIKNLRKMSPFSPGKKKTACFRTGSPQ
ncbi:MAG: cysteine desulfurase NifS [Desulfovibrionaceae bacterium]|nr:cysteine desulfurase NifS [Desulfovibrionaceae bacterium]